MIPRNLDAESIKRARPSLTDVQSAYSYIIQKINTGTVRVILLPEKAIFFLLNIYYIPTL